MPLIKDKYKGDHSRSKYLRNNQVIKNPQVESQYQTTDQKLVAESKNIQKATSNAIGTQSVFGYHIPQNSLTSIGSINPGEILDFINTSYNGSGGDSTVTLLWSTSKPSDVTANVSTGQVTITKGNVFVISLNALSINKQLGRTLTDDFKIKNPKKTIYLYAASSSSTTNITVVKNVFVANTDNSFSSNQDQTSNSFLP
tara:strand:+ start:10531 stop:11127 length:597 start_codon:yes stop_codon:yes gene_type:complete